MKSENLRQAHKKTILLIRFTTLNLIPSQVLGSPENGLLNELHEFHANL